MPQQADKPSEHVRGASNRSAEAQLPSPTKKEPCFIPVDTDQLPSYEEMCGECVDELAPSATPTAAVKPVPASQAQFAGPLPEAMDRWWSADESEILDLLEVFCGIDRPGDMRDATIGAGGRAKGVDKCLAGAAHDVSDDVVFTAMYDAIVQQRVRHLWLGVVCSSFSQLWLKRGRPRLRSRAQPDGISPMPAQWRSYINRANDLVARAETLAHAQWWVGNTYYIENPADVGFWASPFFKWSKRAAVSLWITSPMRRLAQNTNPTWGTTAMCGWRGPFQKITTVCSAGPGAELVESINDVQCTCSEHEMLADGVDSEGQQLSRLAGQYPPLFCGFFGYNFMRPKPWSALEAAAPSPVSDALLRIIEAQRASPRTAEQQSKANRAEAEQLQAQQDAEANITREAWRSAHQAIPKHWPEHEDVIGARYQEAREAPLRYISRRRAESEAAEVLATRPMPRPTATPRTEVRRTYKAVEWPANCPPRPIHISKLYNEGVYDSILADIADVTTKCKTGKEAGRMPKASNAVYRPEESQPEWARECSWDTEDHEDCVPLQPSDEEPPEQGARPEFFSSWSKKLDWGDKDMIDMAARRGTEGLSQCSRATIIAGHHKGLRDHFAIADESVEADRERGFITRGSSHLRVVPSIMVPKNCVERRVWRIDAAGELVRKVKWRVSTDDSISINGETSRNEGMDPTLWEKPGLPSPRTLAEMVAITKSCASSMRLSATRLELEQIALWAFDLSHAYRELAIQKAERGQQCFIWWDGVRLDLRCEFGSAHMVDYFQRVTSFVLAVGRYRIQEYERQHPFSKDREAWLKWRKDECGIEQGCGQSVIYLDDGLGLTVLGPGEQIEGTTDFAAAPVRAGLGMQPDGSIKLSCYVNQSRAQIDLAIMRATFQEAGWGIAVDKVQLGLKLEQLGMLLSSEGDGMLTVPEPKRQGMLIEIDEQRQPSSNDNAVSSEEVDGLVGRCLHIAMAAPEANAFLQPMYAMKEAMRVVGTRADGSKVRVRPSRIAVQGERPKQQAYQGSLNWWHQALSDGISTPLAPRLSFPELGEEGSAFMFSDAAREDGTGYGAFSFVETASGELIFPFIDQRWPLDIIELLQLNKLSMPAGEGLGVVIFADALIDGLPGLTHLTIFTDSTPVQEAIQSSSSGSPQLNFIVNWLFQRHPDVQFMAIHQPGVRNSAADGLSRSASQTVLSDAIAAGANPLRLPLHEHATDLMRVRERSSRG